MKEEKKNINSKELNNNSLEKAVGGIIDLDNIDINKSINDVNYTDTTDVTDDIKSRI